MTLTRTTLGGTPNTVNLPSFGMFIVGQTKPSENQFVTWTQSYSYDAYNQMIWAKSNGSTVTNKYKAEGMRNQITENDSIRNFITVYSDVILEYGEKENTLAVNTYGHNLISRTANNQTMHYLYNACGVRGGTTEKGLMSDGSPRGDFYRKQLLFSFKKRNKQSAYGTGMAGNKVKCDGGHTTVNVWI